MNSALKPFRLLALAILFVAFSCGVVPGSPKLGRRPPQAVADSYAPDGAGVRVEPWVEGLEAPWSLVFLPGGKALVSERPGRIRLIEDGKLRPEQWATVEVAHKGEAGLMGLAVHPEFPNKPFIYAMHTYEREGELINRVIRLRSDGTRGVLDKVIIDGIPGGRFHDGGRLAFGPDGLLYITTGETFEARLARDVKSLGGKILRLTPDGAIPRDNPYGSPVYSFGHRNPQGLAFRPETGDLFESEHGPSGEFAIFGHDEINIITKGGNYGWPDFIGAPSIRPYRDPIIVWKEATPPAGMTFYSGDLLKHLKGDLFVATLRSTCLVRVVLKGEQVTAIERWFTTKGGDDKYGRLRDVAQGPDGALYFLTSNRDGRGDPRPGDDKIYRILPK